MTHTDAVLANDVYRNGRALWDGERYEVYACDEEGPVLIDHDGRAFLVPWSEVQRA